MDPVFKKLNVKDHSDIHVLNAPASFQPVLEEAVRKIRVHRILEDGAVRFLLVFTEQSSEIAEYARKIADRLAEDAVIWFAYPKKSSKKFRSDITRDCGWEPLGRLGLEPVRQVAIDEDWSALRFRDPDHIRTMKRDSGMTISRKGFDRTRKK